MSNAVYRIGIWSGIVAFVSTVGYDVVQLLQVFGVLLFPWYEILIDGFSLCIVIPFVLEILALHYLTLEEKKFWSHAA